VSKLVVEKASFVIKKSKSVFSFFKLFFIFRGKIPFLSRVFLSFSLSNALLYINYCLKVFIMSIGKKKNFSFFS